MQEGPSSEVKRCEIHGSELQPMQVRVIFGRPVLDDSFERLIEARKALFPNARSHVLGGCTMGDGGFEAEALVCLECRVAEREWEETNNRRAEPEIDGIFIPGRKPPRDRTSLAVPVTDLNAPIKYKVCVDFLALVDEPERFAPVYESVEAAIAAAKKIVDAELEAFHQPDMTAEDLYDSYEAFGEDPFIVPAHPTLQFSALDYAKERTPKDWPRLFGFFGEVEDRGQGWYAVPLHKFPFPLVAKITRDEPLSCVEWVFRGFWRGEGRCFSSRLVAAWLSGDSSAFRRARWAGSLPSWSHSCWRSVSRKCGSPGGAGSDERRRAAPTGLLR